MFNLYLLCFLFCLWLPPLKKARKPFQKAGRSLWPFSAFVTLCPFQLSYLQLAARFLKCHYQVLSLDSLFSPSQAYSVLCSGSTGSVASCCPDCVGRLVLSTSFQCPRGCLPPAASLRKGHVWLVALPGSPSLPQSCGGSRDEVDLLVVGKQETNCWKITSQNKEVDFSLMATGYLGFFEGLGPFLVV